jgi:hypothetical protein
MKELSVYKYLLVGLLLISSSPNKTLKINRVIELLIELCERFYVRMTVHLL